MRLKINHYFRFCVVGDSRPFQTFGRLILLKTVNTTLAKLFSIQCNLVLTAYTDIVLISLSKIKRIKNGIILRSDGI